MQLEVNKEYTVTVQKILKTGIIATVDGSEDTEYIHISKISKDYVQDIEEYVSIGDVLNAKAIFHKDKPELSLQHLPLKRKQPKSIYIPPTPNNSSNKSLDDMIAAANASLKDKIGRSVNQPSRKRKNKRRQSDVPE